MKNKTNLPDTKDKNHQYAFTPLITTVDLPLVNRTTKKRGIYPREIR